MDYEEITLRELSCNLDDITPEVLSWTSECLFKIGARDVWLSPILMKKSRLGQMLSVLYDEHLETQVLEIIFKETTTLGVRIKEVRRVELKREEKIVKTEFGEVRVKIAKNNSEKILNSKPEISDCEKLAKENNVPLKAILRAVLNACP